MFVTPCLYEYKYAHVVVCVSISMATVAIWETLVLSNHTPSNEAIFFSLWCLAASVTNQSLKVKFKKASPPQKKKNHEDPEGARLNYTFWDSKIDRLVTSCDVIILDFEPSIAYIARCERTRGVLRIYIQNIITMHVQRRRRESTVTISVRPKGFVSAASFCSRLVPAPTDCSTVLRNKASNRLSDGGRLSHVHPPLAASLSGRPDTLFCSHP